MFIGEYTHSIDDKKRLSVPAKFRKVLGKKAVITHGLNRCLAIYSAKEWAVFAEKLAKLSMGRAEDRGFSRFMLAGAYDVEVDSIGRVLVPENLRAYAGLGEKVVLAGVYDRIEVWDDAAWKSYKASLEAKADEVAERLGESGVF